MFKRLVTLVRGLMGCQSTAPSSLTAEQPSPSAKPLRAKSTQASLDAQAPVKLKPKRKSRDVNQTTQVKSRKAVQKPVQMESGNLGQSSKTLVPQTQSPARTQLKLTQEAAQSTTAVAKPGRKKLTARQVAMVSQSKPTGSKSKIPAFPIRLPAKPAVKAKAARVPSIKAALLSQLERVPALTLTEVQSGDLGQVKVTARKTRQPASQARTPKQKVVVSTSAAKKTTRSKTPVQTRTVRQSKASGS